jgi:excinuclease UvrABC ATPase subunit
MIKLADYVIKLGPEGGDKGGYLLTEAASERGDNTISQPSTNLPLATNF